MSFVLHDFQYYMEKAFDSWVDEESLFEPELDSDVGLNIVSHSGIEMLNKSTFQTINCISSELEVCSNK